MSTTSTPTSTTPSSSTSDLSSISTNYMPHEGHPHSHTIMGYPSLPSVETLSDLQASQTEVLRIANAISHFEPVHLYTRLSELPSVQFQISTNPNITAFPAPLDQLWVRDSAPIYVYNGTRRKAVLFNFNYWGAKVEFTGDEGFAKHVSPSQPGSEINGETQVVKALITAEGGAIEVDGEGTFLGTESSLINSNRNPGMSRVEIEAELSRTLGVSHFIWLRGIKAYDITDYHIDILARFVRPGLVVLSRPNGNAERFVWEAYEQAKQVLSESVDAMGRRIEVVEVEEPDGKTLGKADVYNEVVASYVNYHLVNGGIVLPGYGVEELDHKAVELFKGLFPHREVVQVHINMLARTGGGIHCATQQVLPVVRE